jgi:hypothetical protein
MRSGTNLLTWVLRHNFADVQTFTMLLGWKHGPIYRDRAVLQPDDYVDPRFREGIRNFMRDQPQPWQRMLASPAFAAAAAAQRDQSFGVALAVRDPALWYASCVRVHGDAPGFLLHGVAPAEAAGFWNASYEAWLAALGERAVIVNTDRLRTGPEPWLAQMAAGLRIVRLPGVQLPVGYLHPQGTEEVYELLGAPIERDMDREFTTLGSVDSARVAEFTRLLDPGLLARLGFAS